MKCLSSLIIVAFALLGSACGFPCQSKKITISEEEVLAQVRKDCPECYSRAVAKALGLSVGNQAQTATKKEPAKPAPKPTPNPCATPKPADCTQTDLILRDTCEVLTAAR